MQDTTTNFSQPPPAYTPRPRPGETSRVTYSMSGPRIQATNSLNNYQDNAQTSLPGTTTTSERLLNHTMRLQNMMTIFTQGQNTYGREDRAFDVWYGYGDDTREVRQQVSRRAREMCPRARGQESVSESSHLSSGEVAWRSEPAVGDFGSVTNGVTNKSALEVGSVSASMFAGAVTGPSITRESEPGQHHSQMRSQPRDGGRFTCSRNGRFNRNDLPQQSSETFRVVENYRNVQRQKFQQATNDCRELQYGGDVLRNQEENASTVELQPIQPAQLEVESQTPERKSSWWRRYFSKQYRLQQELIVMFMIILVIAAVLSIDGVLYFGRQETERKSSVLAASVLPTLMARSRFE